MKKRTIILVAVQIMAILIGISSLYAWTGDTWSSISRQTILKIADEMVDFSWTPKSNINNWNYGSVWQPFNAGTVYYGEAYTQSGTTANPQRNWEEFYGVVKNTSGGNTYYGNDCSGFVSMSWKLPKRYTTTSFESDATSDGGYVTSLGPISNGQKIQGLLLGDALVTTGHIIMFENYLSDGSGIKAIEQTPNSAVRTEKYKWDRLASYRPIRRNKIDEGNYVFKTKWGKQGDLNGQFNEAEGIAVDSSNNVYVVDAANRCVQKFDGAGSFITKWGTYGSGNGQFNIPWGIAVDSSSYVYVVDLYNYIQKFTSNGSFISKWGSHVVNVCAQGYFAAPFNADVDSSNNVYVTDPGCYLQKFTSDGSFLTWWLPKYGTCLGGLEGPIAVDRVRNVLYLSSGCNSILKYTTNGSFITTWGSYGSQDGYFDSPAGVAVDSSGNVYVADKGNHRIQKFDNNGNFITKWGSNGWTGNGQFQYPNGVAVDAALNVYVADTYNDRIQKFAPVSKLPTGPSNLAATAVSSSQINLSWQDNSTNEKGFKIKRKNGSNGTYTAIATVGANVTNYADSGIVDGGTRYYVVWTYNDNGESAYSDEVSAYVSGSKPNPPAVPSNLTARIGADPMCLGGYEIKLNWFDNSNNESGFKIEEKMCQPTCGSFTSRWTVGANTNTANVRCLSKTIKGYFYYYRIKAYNQDGESAYSNETTIKH
jgi:hypothetical protein